MSRDRESSKEEAKMADEPKSDQSTGCGVCVYFTLPTGNLKLLTRQRNSAEGICRRWPPQSLGHSSERAVQPEVSKADWCGEFKKA